MPRKLRDCIEGFRKSHGAQHVRKFHCLKSVGIQSSGSVFYRTWTEYGGTLSTFSPNAGKYGPGKLRIRTLSSQCQKRAIDKEDCVLALLMNPSKAFDTRHLDLMLAKLKAHGFFKEALKLIKSSLINLKQKAQINNKLNLESGYCRFHMALKMHLFFSIYL